MEEIETLVSRNLELSELVNELSRMTEEEACSAWNLDSKAEFIEDLLDEIAENQKHINTLLQEQESRTSGMDYEALCQAVGLPTQENYILRFN